MQNQRKRFIAGAICPQCAKADRIVVYRQDNKDYRECVACDFFEEMDLTLMRAAPETPNTGSDNQQIVRIMPPKLP